MNAIGFNRTAAEMVGAALPRLVSIEDRVALLEEQSFLLAECQRGEDALIAADAAVGLGSQSLRTHYLRGRALGLVGRLEEVARKWVPFWPSTQPMPTPRVPLQ